MTVRTVLLGTAKVTSELSSPSLYGHFIPKLLGNTVGDDKEPVFEPAIVATGPLEGEELHGGMHVARKQYLPDGR